MSAKAMQLRTDLEVKLIGAHQGLLLLCAEVPVQKRAVRRKLGELETTWEKLVISHSTFCASAQVSPSSNESKEFIREKEKLREEAVQAAETALGEDDKTDVIAKRSKKHSDKLKTFVEANLTSLEELANGQLTREQYEETMLMVQELSDKVDRYVELSEDAEELLEGAAATNLAKVTQEASDKHVSRLSQVKLAAMKKAPVKQEPKVTAGTERASSTGPARGAQKLPVKIKPLDCPTWDGKFKTFARFKKMWSENITPRHEDSALHLMLCQALPKNIMDNISSLSSSADDIRAYLDDKYGKTDVVAREIMAELMGLDSKKLGQRFIGRFCTTLLDTHALLASMGEEDWLTASRSVSELENKLPREEKMEWARQYEVLPGDTKFEKFKEFLQQRKRVMEALEFMGDKPNMDKLDTCGYCSKPGHTENRCFAKQRNDIRGGSQDDRRSRDGCEFCGSSGHWKNECPDKGTEEDRKFALVEESMVRWEQYTASNRMPKMQIFL